MKDLTETILSIALAIALIAVTYSYLGAWLTGLVTTSFSNVSP